MTLSPSPSASVMRVRGFYGMVDLAPGQVARAAPLAHALLDGGARVLQLRMKHADAREMLAACEVLRPLCVNRATFIVNDRVDVAILAGADGVHLGQTDISLADARRLRSVGFLVGISTHDEQQARDAVAGGADYIGFGPVFGTRTKDNPDPTVGVVQLAAVCRASKIPVVAIGGVTTENIGEVVRAGAAAAAVIAAVNNAGDIRAAARAISSAWS